MYFDLFCEALVEVSKYAFETEGSSAVLVSCLVGEVLQPLDRIITADSNLGGQTA
jgi:hypothetical protein